MSALTAIHRTETNIIPVHQAKLLDDFSDHCPQRSKLIPLQELEGVINDLRTTIETRMVEGKDTAGALAFLFAPYGKAEFQDQKMAVKIYAAILLEHPAVVARPAIDFLHRNKPFLPRPSELKQALENEEHDIYRRLHRAERMQAEHVRRQKEREEEERIERDRAEWRARQAQGGAT